MFRASALALGVALLASTAQAESPAGCAAPAAIGDGWSVSEPQAQQLDPALICGIEAKLERLKDANPHGVVIVRNGVVVYETYFAGPAGVYDFEGQGPQNLACDTVMDAGVLPAALHR